MSGTPPVPIGGRLVSATVAAAWCLFVSAQLAAQAPETAQLQAQLDTVRDYQEQFLSVVL